MIPIEPAVKENEFQAFFSFYPVIPSKYDGEEQNIYERGRGVHFEKQNAHQRGILLFQTPTTQWRKEYHLLTLKNNQRRSLIFKWVQNLEITSSSMCYMH